jgi:hypothetical protein
MDIVSYVSRAFQQYQEHDGGHHNLGDFNITNKLPTSTNYLLQLIDSVNTHKFTCTYL